MGRTASRAEAAAPNTRIVHLRFGDEVKVEDAWRKLLAISTFFEREISGIVFLDKNFYFSGTLKTRCAMYW